MGIKLLLADDAAFIREVVTHLVVGSGIEIVGEAVDGEEAVILAKQLNPDVILMDIVMPRKSGIEATQEILAANPKIKVIACSTVDQETMVMRALEAGCCSYIVKPFTKNNVLEAVRAAAVLRKES